MNAHITTERGEKERKRDMFGVTVHNHDFNAHVAMPVMGVQIGQVVQITETDIYRDENDELVFTDQSWQAQVSETDISPWNAPNEVFVSFDDGPGAWVLKDMSLPLVMGPLNSSGRF